MMFEVKMALENLNATSIILFLVGLLVSAAVIYIVTLFASEKRSIKLALFAAIIGSIVYVVVYALFENPILSGAIGGLAWWLALKTIYRMRWLKSLIVAVAIWIITAIIGTVVPTAIGPL